MISIEKYLELLKAKREGRLSDALSDLAPGCNKSESEFKIANLWLESMNENSEMFHDCSKHGETKIKPTIHMNNLKDYSFIMENGLRLELKQPPFVTSSVGEQVLNSIKYVVTETENIKFEDLSEQELKNLTDQMTLSDMKKIIEHTNQEVIYMTYKDCCDKNITVVGFDKIMEII